MTRLTASWKLVILLGVNILIVEGQFDGRSPIQPSIGGGNSAACPLRPLGCNLNCPHGFAWGIGNLCLCVCQMDPCLNKICSFGETCIVSHGSASCISKLISTSQRQQFSSTLGECPKLVGGLCIERCKADSDCSAQMKCCSNGCGRECVLPVHVAPILNQLPIQPLSSSSLHPKNNNFEAAIIKNNIHRFPERPQPVAPIKTTTEKIGHCPMKAILKDQKCEVECNRDSDCAGVAKCCDSGCGRSCAAPERATTCIHLLSAVERLPSKQLSDGYVPACSLNNGLFEPIQCDLSYCWCVNLNTGIEIHGTKLSADQKTLLRCDSPRKCLHENCETKNCPFGLRTDLNGCPLPSCECKNICDSVSCANKFDECQLVEPDCAKAPCSPVPRCLLNPCSNGLPMTLPSGVTALCTQTSQCWNNFWCHQIGYNGLGFCCPAPESAARQGFCESRVPRHMTNCAAECRSDVDCPSTSKCCFDGCGLKCMNVQFTPNPFHHRPEMKHVIEKIDTLAFNKGIINNLLAECPESLFTEKDQDCRTECKTDSDCQGLQRCCSSGCSKVCVYPQKTTSCMHDAITHEVYVLKNAPKCTSAGNYDERQCEDERCYCVDPITGVQVPNTWVPLGNEPLCKAIHDNTCPILSCSNSCPYGYQLDGNGCSTCDCKNPCAEVHCPQGLVCIVADVSCFQKTNCAKQPRCVQNVCQGHPLTDRNGLVEQCSQACPQGFWCNNVGFPGNGGICCPEIIASQGQQITQALPTIHLGKCPKMPVSVKTLTSPQTCRAQCRSDADCPSYGKCCFDGCGTKCIQVSAEVSSSHVGPVETVSSGFSQSVPIRPVNSLVKIGECPRLPQSPRLDCRSGQDDCKSDYDCDGIKKCCSDGCFKRCMYATKTTACLHLKAAFEKVANGDVIKCLKTGEFEEIQCGSKYCWCVDRHGKEVVGTRISKELRPDCKARRFCEDQNCSGHTPCPYGYAKDSNGCETCECENPCQRAQCPSSDQICVPHPVECIEGVCPQVPKCVVNVCANGFPLYHETTWEPVFCNEDSQCHGTNTHCRIFKSNGGYCCIGDTPSKHPGTCPRQKLSLYPPQDDKCEISCKEDNDCQNHEKCCQANGCSLACVPAENVPTTTPVLHSTNQKVGKCPVVENLSSKVCGSARVNTCQEDDDCPFIQKCCFDGCAKTCQYAEITTDCFNAKAAAESIKRLGDKSIYEPKCDASGAFETIQSHRGLSWCVDTHGKEIPGTRTSRATPNCDQPRSCPVLSCSKQCLLGHEMNDQGCPACECKNPCLNVNCPLNHVCRIIPTQCFLATCTYVPRCLLNACPRGEPLERPDTGLLADCDDSIGRKCPQGWFCHQFGMGSSGYCCAGAAPLSQLQASTLCPAVPILVQARHGDQHQLECKLNHDCIQNGPCCFNGAGTYCKHGIRHTPEAPSEATVTPIQAITSVVANFEKIGVCPSNPISNPGCRSDCTRDSECLDFQKCCVYGCGKMCQYPKVATSCIHKVASFNEEIPKFVSGDDSPQAKPPVQCTNDGLFRRIQCNQDSRQCWCVDINSGIEIIGTRITSLSGQEPNCLRPRFCATSCHDVECEHGYRLDKNGCPLDGFCQCKTPCDDIKCAKEDDICIHKSMTCLGNPCPSVGICRSNPCKGGVEPLKDINGIIATCVNDEGCGIGTCQYLIGENQKGVCCPKDSPIQAFSPQMKIGDCPVKPPAYLKITKNCKNECSSDNECHGNQKCCEYECNSFCIGPSNATNCLHMQSAIITLQKQHAVVQFHNPQCDLQSGMYVATQCDVNENCWCVDTVTGVAFYGTKASGNGVNVCTTRRACPIQCDDRRTVCPFGFETNSQGCPRSSNCRCRNPCDQVQCPGNQVCLLRPTHSCRDQTCLPVPTCEDNPCINKQKPAVEPRTYTQFTCLENRSQICPTGFYCTAYDENSVGVCCPGQEPILSQQIDVAICPHGDAFSNQADGSPSECSVNQNDCPSTHYCMSKPSHAKGICCVTKRYVCNLEKDPGPCNAMVPRYYYDVDQQKCLAFTYSGCSGNLNNFGTSIECEHFCVGTGVDILNTVMSDDGSHVLMDIYHMGFSLTGPLLREKHSPEINNAFREYLTKTFNLEDDEIRDLYIKDDNTVRFSINAPDAREKANNISDAVSNGHLKFLYKNDIYKAQPQTWFLHQIKEEPVNGGFSNTFIFWALMTASGIFALAVLVALCCGCTFLKNKVKDTAASLRGPSPSPYGQISAYLPHAHAHAHSPARSTASHNSAPALSQRKSTKKHVFSTDDISAMRQNVVGGGNLLTPAMSADGTHSMVGAHTQGGRRPSRATLYY